MTARLWSPDGLGEIEIPTALPEIRVPVPAHILTRMYDTDFPRVSRLAVTCKVYRRGHSALAPHTIDYYYDRLEER